MIIKHANTTTSRINDALSNLERDERTLLLPGLTGPGWEPLQLSLAQFEASFQDFCTAFVASLEDDSLAPYQPPEDPRQCTLVWERKGKQGGAHRRPPPPLEEIVAATHGVMRRKNVKGGRPDATFEEIAQRLHWLYKHRGRGLSETDEEYQKELCVARSLGYGYFIDKGVRGDRLGVPAAVESKLGNLTASRSKIVAAVIEGKRVGYSGIYMSASEFERALKIPRRTFWDGVNFLERLGIITVIRTYKIGRKGRPVGLAKNWIGPGPALRELESLYMPKQSELFDPDRARELTDEWKGEVKRRWARQLRGRARELGFFSRFEFARELVAAAEDFERLAAEHRQHEEESFADVKHVTAKMAAGELPDGWLDAGAVVNKRLGGLGEPPKLLVPAVVVETARLLLEKGAAKLVAWLHEGIGVKYDRLAAFTGRLLKRDGEECPGGALPFGEERIEELGATFVQVDEGRGEEIEDNEVEDVFDSEVEDVDPDPAEDARQRQAEGVKLLEQVRSELRRRELAQKSGSAGRRSSFGGTPHAEPAWATASLGSSLKLGKPADPRVSTLAPDHPPPSTFLERDAAPTTAEPQPARVQELNTPPPFSTASRASSGGAFCGPSRAQPPPEVRDEDRSLFGNLPSSVVKLAAAVLAGYQQPAADSS